jgi:Zn-dependent protease/predicted transcriptional regulator
MFGKRITLFKILGFSVHVDLSWLVIALLVTWSLAEGLFPSYYPGLPESAYWRMGVIGALGFFASIVFHELSHSLVARRFGIPMKGITLFIFGGVAEMDDEPPSARAEFFMAIAGPLSSIAIGLLFFAVYALRPSEAPGELYGVLGYLAAINLLLAGFNLLPAYPLDGGRVLRSALWYWKKDLRRATRIASRIGSGFGVLLIALGVLRILTGNIIGGLWQFMIGMFLRNAAQMSYQQVLIRRALEGETVDRLMKTDPVTVPPSITLTDLVQDYVYRHQFRMYPVVDRGRLMGCITTRRLKDIPREEWARLTVGEAANACTRENTVGPATDAVKALGLMNRTGNSRLMVVADGKLVGVLTLKDIMGFLAVKLDLERNDE